jgi:hypothetical protein
MTRLVCRASVIVALACAAGCSPKPKPETTPVAPTATVKAGDLLKEYGANAVAADTKYKGKVIQVSGKFGSAQKAPLMGYAVQLLPDDAGELTSAVQCFVVESAEADVGKMNAGQAVTLQGTCDGQVLGQIKLSKCTIVK